MKEDIKFEKRCVYFNHCKFSVKGNCEGCNIYEYTHHFEDFMIKLQKIAKNNSIEKYLKVFKNSILS